jgi:hypothetical protein
MTPLPDKADIVRDVKSADQHLAVSVAQQVKLLLVRSSFLHFGSWAGWVISMRQPIFITQAKASPSSAEGMVVVDAVMCTGIFATGSLVAGTLICSLIWLWLAEKLYAPRLRGDKTEDRSRKSLVNIFGKQPRSVWVEEMALKSSFPSRNCRLVILLS